MRYNAYNDEIEFTNNPKAVSSDKILMKHTNISCQIESNKYNYVNYVDDKNIKQKGYLVELFLGGGFDDDNDDQDGGMMIPAYSNVKN